MMEQFVGSIYSGDTVLLEDIEGSLHIETSESGWKSWHGSFELDVKRDIDLGGEYLLKLNDGRKGKFTIKHRQTTGSGINIEFQGTGPLA